MKIFRRKILGGCIDLLNEIINNPLIVDGGFSEEYLKIEKEILYRYFNGDATPEEEHKIRQYLEASDENWKEYLRERKFFDTIILKEQVVSEEKQMKAQAADSEDKS